MGTDKKGLAAIVAAILANRFRKHQVRVVLAWPVKAPGELHGDLPGHKPVPILSLIHI